MSLEHVQLFAANMASLLSSECRTLEPLLPATARFVSAKQTERVLVLAQYLFKELCALPLRQSIVTRWAVTSRWTRGLRTALCHGCEASMRRPSGFY